MLLAPLALAACAPRARYALLPEARGVGEVRSVFVSTSRALGPDGALGAGRSPDLRFGRVDVSVPPDRAPGSVPTPRRRPDPRAEFVSVGEEVYTGEAAFVEGVGTALAALPRERREVVLYVHGFNTTTAEGAFRVAQLAHDLSLPGVAAHYAWPSAARPLGYVHDRDAALFARDGLERTMTALGRTGAERVIVVAHSLGALLTMETLRQHAMGGGDAAAMLGGVVLISPDLDVALFRAQAVRIGRLPQPFLVVVSRRDRVLRLSARLSGRPARLGNLDEPDALAGWPVTIIDVSSFSTPRGANHFLAGDSPALLALLASMRETDAAFAGLQGRSAEAIPGEVSILERARKIVLDPP